MGKRRARAAAATRIQAAFRGYNVRRRTPLMHLRVIRNVRLKLGELQARAAEPAYMDKICADAMERRKLMEEAMAILLQLDGIQGVHPSVRGVRKSVNREVVQFMELIDVVVMGAESEEVAIRTSTTEATTTMSSGTSEFDHSPIPKPGTSVLSSDNSCVDNSLSDRRKTQSSSSSALDSGDPVDMEEMPRAQMREQKCVSSSNGRHLKDDHPESGSTSGIYSRAGSFGVQESSGNHDFEADAIWVETPAEAALLVQSTFRGYRVRRTDPLKHLRVISEVRSKLEELCIQVSEPGFSSNLRSDGMERLRLSECITSLLIRLDSVQGVDEVVRDIRKSVTKEVFKLQDFVDSIISHSRGENSIEESMQPLLTTDMAEQEIEQSMEDSSDATTPTVTVEHGPSRVASGNEAVVEKLSLIDRDLEPEATFGDHYDDHFLPQMTSSSVDQKRGKESGHSEPDRSGVCDISSTTTDADQMEMQNTGVSFDPIEAVDDHGRPIWVPYNPPAYPEGEVTHVLEGDGYGSYDNVTELEEVPESLMADPRISEFEDPSVLFVGSEDDVQPMVESSYVRQHSPDISEHRLNVASAAEQSSAYSHPSPILESFINDFNALEEDYNSLQRINSGTVDASTCTDASIHQIQSNHRAELDLIAQKYNFVPDIHTPPNLIAGEERLPTNGISIKVENDLPSDMEVEDGNHTGISTLDNYVQESLGVEMTGEPSDEDGASQDGRPVIDLGDLIQENARLRTLINEVLIFTEVQSAQTAAAMAKVDKLEVQVLLHKKSAEIWRKRSLLARRKK